jgi:hypothetical protein
LLIALSVVGLGTFFFAPWQVTAAVFLTILLLVTCLQARLAIATFPTLEATGRCGERLSEVRQQGRRLERTLLSRLEGSTLSESEAHGLKARHHQLRQALQAPNPANPSQLEAVLIPLEEAVQQAREAVDALPPSQRVSLQALRQSISRPTAPVSREL